MAASKSMTSGKAKKSGKPRMAPKVASPNPINGNYMKEAGMKVLKDHCSKKKGYQNKKSPSIKRGFFIIIVFLVYFPKRIHLKHVLDSISILLVSHSNTKEYA